MSTAPKRCGQSRRIGRHVSAQLPMHAASAMSACAVSPQPPSLTGSRAWRSARLRSAGVACAVPTTACQTLAIAASCTAAASRVAATPIVRRKYTSDVLAQ